MAVATPLSLEDTIDVLEAKFVDNGFENAPPGLVALLKMPQSDATGRAGRAKLYRRLYGILWHGGKIGAGYFEGNQPTYIYPAALKDVVRPRFPEELDTVPKPDPEGETVYTVTYQDLYQAKWPAIKGAPVRRQATSSRH